jgi:hypothetical protein
MNSVNRESIGRATLSVIVAMRAANELLSYACRPLDKIDAKEFGELLRGTAAETTNARRSMASTGDAIAAAASSPPEAFEEYVNVKGCPSAHHAAVAFSSRVCHEAATAVLGRQESYFDVLATSRKAAEAIVDGNRRTLADAVKAIVDIDPVDVNFEGVIRQESARAKLTLGSQMHDDVEDDVKATGQETGQKEKKLPKNPKVLELARRLSEPKNKGRQRIDIAREIADTEGEAESLVRQLRPDRYGHLLDEN